MLSCILNCFFGTLEHPNEHKTDQLELEPRFNLLKSGPIVSAKLDWLGILLSFDLLLQGAELPI